MAQADPVPAALTQSQLASAQSYLNDGQPAQALPIAEALVSQEPGNKLFRFQLALALFQLNKDVRARYHLEQLRGAALSPQERVIVDRMIDQIAARKHWAAYFSINIKPESNGTRQTSNKNLVVQGLPVTLDDAAVGKPTTSLLINTGFTYSPTLREGLKAQLGLATSLKFNETKALRDYQLTGRAGLSWQGTPRRLTSAGIILGKRWIGDTPYSETIGVFANHAQRIGDKGTLRFGTELTRIHRTEGRASIDRSLLTFDYSHAVSAQARLGFGGFYERSATDQANLDGRRTGLRLSGAYMFKGGLTTRLTLSGEIDNRTGTNALFGVSRSDQKVAVDLSAFHRDFTIGAFAPEIRIGFERNESNIPLADFTNRYISIGLTREF